MKTGTKIFLGLLGVGLTAGAAYLMSRKSTNPYKPSALYEVDNLYTLPEGAVEVSTKEIPRAMVDAVKWVHRYFVLSAAYTDGDKTFLVEEHEGFDPLVFLVMPKDAAVEPVVFKVAVKDQVFPSEGFGMSHPGYVVTRHKGDLPGGLVQTENVSEEFMNEAMKQYPGFTLTAAYATDYGSYNGTPMYLVQEG